MTKGKPSESKEKELSGLSCNSEVASDTLENLVGLSCGNAACLCIRIVATTNTSAKFHKIPRSTRKLRNALSGGSLAALAK